MSEEEYRGPNGIGLSDTELQFTLACIGLLIATAFSVALLPVPWVCIPGFLVGAATRSLLSWFWPYFRKTYLSKESER